jgi:hypothetical protein
MSPKFSIVTSFFGDDPSYIHRLYECAKSQNVDWEWVVTDDFSDNSETDKTLLEISKIDKRVRRIIQTEKLEFYRNPSLYTKGEFIFHIDGDDFYHPSYLEHCQIWFDRLPDVSIILSGSRWVKKSGHIERYYIHTPFSEDYDKNGNVVKSINFLGRVWRSKYKIDWSEIINSDEMIRMNDKYIVNYLSTKGDVLCLPRCYVQYETCKISNSTKERTSDEKIMIRNLDDKFCNWFEKNKKDIYSSTYFYCGDNKDFEISCYPLLELPWSKEIKNISYLGFPDSSPKRKLLKDLFIDINIKFEYDSNSEIIVINSLDGKLYKTLGEKNLILTNSEDTKDFYFNLLKEENRKFAWFFCNGFCWITTL